MWLTIFTIYTLFEEIFMAILGVSLYDASIRNSPELFHHKLAEFDAEENLVET